MTTPVSQAARTDGRQSVGLPSLRAQLVAWGLMIAAGATILVPGIGRLFTEDGFGDTLPMLAVGLVGILGGVIAYARLTIRRGERLRRPAMLGPGTFVLAGAAVGSWWLDLASDADRRITLPIAITLTALFTLTLVVGLRRMRRRCAEQRSFSDAVVSGCIAPGEVTEELPAPAAADAEAVRADLTVAYIAPDGVTRSATRPVWIARSEVPSRGDRVAVLIDPSDPENPDRTWIGPVDARSAADFDLWAG